LIFYVNIEKPDLKQNGENFEVGFHQLVKMLLVVYFRSFDGKCCGCESNCFKVLLCSVLKDTKFEQKILNQYFFVGEKITKVQIYWVSCQIQCELLHLEFGIQ
jgi:hypothetical protein